MTTWRDLFRIYHPRRWALVKLGGVTLTNGDHELRITLRRVQ